jgi:pantetheine-phosphate adenylyltransferase
MQKTVIFPGSFDPITKGHVNLIERAAQLFDKVIVVIATNTRKSTWLSAEQRIILVREALSQYTCVEVKPWSGVIVEFAKQEKALAMVRGLRTAADYENEFQLAGMNRKMSPDIATVFLPAGNEYAFISATLVREILLLGGDVSEFVPEMVLQRLKEWHKITN